MWAWGDPKECKYANMTEPVLMYMAQLEWDEEIHEPYLAVSYHGDGWCQITDQMKHNRLTYFSKVKYGDALPLHRKHRIAILRWVIQNRHTKPERSRYIATTARKET